MAFSAVLLSAGCATDVSDGFGGGGTAAGQTTAATTTGSTSASTSSGGTCAQDCSTIPTPECYEAVCNMQTGACDLQPMADGAGCEDGLYCTENDTCDAGLCQAGTPRQCEPGMDDCTMPACDEDADACLPFPKPNGTPCTSNDPCTANSICQNGVCLGAPKDCSATPVPDVCHVAVCDPMQNGLCVPVPGNQGQACTFGDPCMVQKTCDQGQCVGGTPKVCPSNGCNNGVCDPPTGNCTLVPVPPGGQCNEATDACNTGYCNMSGQCIGQPDNEGASCNDGNACTVNDVCGGGTCLGTPDPNYTIYFNETFANNNAGWTLGPEWAIGPAVASTCASSSTGNDPGTDHTASADNGIAGVLIGGCYPTTLHGDYCITSPDIDTSTAPGSLFLSFWRHLHTDYPSFITSHVDVSANGGTTWTAVWTHTSSFINDAQWTNFSYDITSYKATNMRVRFCYMAGSSGIITGGGWNVDDVTIANAPCP